MKKALIFDMDGVIIDSEGAHLNAMYRYLVTRNPSLRMEDLYQIVGRSSKDVWDRIAALVGDGRDGEAIREEYRNVWTPAHPAEINYREIFRPETKELLLFAREAGLKTAVASSTAYQTVTEVMREVGIDELLDLVMSGEFFERSKPDPAIYLKTAELLSVNPGDCLVIEDSTVGIAAAHAAGMEVAALIDLRFGFDRSLADHEISSLLEAKQHL